MTAPHELVATLRVLKLSGMLDTLEARLAQARAGELGHLEFLQVLYEDEINRRAATALTRCRPSSVLTRATGRQRVLPCQMATCQLLHRGLPALFLPP